MENSRIIKFRAWDKKNSEMFVPSMITSAGDSCKPYGIDNWCEAILMQYTGLKDKNGLQEMYESDLVERDGIKGEVRWDAIEARFRIYCDDAKPIPCNYPLDSSWTVVGNKYEN